LTPGAANEAGVYDDVEKIAGLEARVGMPLPASSIGGSRQDVGTLALALVVNKYINGETVLIDGGVSPSTCTL